MHDCILRDFVMSEEIQHILPEGNVEVETQVLSKQETGMGDNIVVPCDGEASKNVNAIGGTVESGSMKNIVENANEFAITRSEENAGSNSLEATGDSIAELHNNSILGADKDANIPADVSISKHKDEAEDAPSFYNIKWIKYKNNELPIITQNDNGPCPLLAIMNYLLLQQKITLPPSTEVIPSSNLISSLAEYIFDNVPKNINAETRLNYEQKMNDAIAMFPKLQTGLDVNIRFTGITDFEYTSSSEVFDLLDIPLYHGWLVDPESVEVRNAVGNASYNQLVEKIINLKSSANSEEAAQAIVAEEFLRSSASQITYHGLSLLSSYLKDSQMGVLFRNNHFHTILKHNGELYVLATDQGFLHEKGVVWETLSNIEGDSHFVDACFKVFQQSASKPSAQAVQPTAYANTAEQIDQDYLVALSLQREQGETTDQFSSWAALGLSDHELAMRLQEEENKLAEAAPTLTERQQSAPTTQQRQRVSTTSTGSVNREKKGLCSVM